MQGPLVRYSRNSPQSGQQPWKVGVTAFPQDAQLMDRGCSPLSDETAGTEGPVAGAG